VVREDETRAGRRKLVTMKKKKVNPAKQAEKLRKRHGTNEANG